MGINYKKIFSFLTLFLIICLYSQCQLLPRSNPEDQGVSSKGILSFIDAMTKSKNELHGFMFLRHGKVIAEAWAKPYGPQLKHSMYSLSKSFTSTAIGLALTEKRLSLNDKVISFFPEYVPEKKTNYLEELTIKDLLTMSVGQKPDPTFSIVQSDSNWIRMFLSKPILSSPGTVFLYNTMATYMLSAIIQKVTGQKLIDYLTPRLFEPLGVKGMDWEEDEAGINTGGWGLRITTEDMAKFGQLYLQKGNWGSKQLLPSMWVDEATSFKILQSPEVPKFKRDSSDWLQGYCYQFWRCRHNAYRGDGAFGQYIIVMPDQDAVVAITSETMDMQDELNKVWDYLLPSIHKNQLEPDKNAEKQLKEKLSSLELPLKKGQPLQSSSSLLNHKEFTFDSNPKHIKSVQIEFKKDECYLTVKYDTSLFKFGFSSTGWLTGITNEPGPSLLMGSKLTVKRLAPYKIAGHFYWYDINNLEFQLKYLESPHSELIHCEVQQDKIIITFSNSFGSNSHQSITGYLRK